MIASLVGCGKKLPVGPSSSTNPGGQTSGQTTAAASNKKPVTTNEPITYKAPVVEQGETVDGHAPLLSGKDLDKYIYEGIEDDHECTNIDEVIKKTQYN